MSMRPFVLVTLLSLVGSAAHAQSLGAFRWQLQPYCNVLTLTVTKTGKIYTLDGFDDQCGAATVAPVTGTAAPNPNGTIEMGLNVVTSPGGAPLHVAVPLSVATLGGSWKDSAGNTGSFVFTPGAGTGGNVRPPSAALGAVAVDPAQIQLRVEGGCSTGQAVQGINQDGSVSCAAAATGGITAVQTPSGSGLQSTINGGQVTLALAKTASGAFNISNPVGLLSNTTSGTSTHQFIWHAAKGALRAGSLTSTSNQWDLEFAGSSSVAMGFNTQAGGSASIALGSYALASGQDSVAIGHNLDTLGRSTIVLGTDAGTTQAGTGSFVFGDFAPGYAGTFLQSFAANQFLVRAVGGTTFFSNGALTAGVKLAPGASAWSALSDVNMKENFRDLDDHDVLAKISRMPIREWNYKAQDAAIRHVGPTAQDFHAAFGLGEDPLRISTIDADGIALAGLKALEARAREQHDAVVRLNDALLAEIASLRARLDRLEAKER